MTALAVLMAKSIQVIAQNKAERPNLLEAKHIAEESFLPNSGLPKPSGVTERSSFCRNLVVAFHPPQSRRQETLMKHQRLAPFVEYAERFHFS